tara:strand:+ start:348 stop:521 length:174 start_codon:yes stop_codon:yes gene_type:complete
VSEQNSDLRRQIIEAIQQDEEDHHVLPHYGLIADWRVRYVDLRSLILKYLKEQDGAA